MANERKGFMEGRDESIGKGQHANMPTEVMMSQYPKERMTRDENLDDSMSEIDDVVGRSEGKRRRYISNQH